MNEHQEEPQTESWEQLVRGDWNAACAAYPDVRLYEKQIADWWIVLGRRLLSKTRQEERQRVGDIEGLRSTLEILESRGRKVIKTSDVKHYLASTRIQEGE